MKGIAGYSRPGKNGGVEIMVEDMAVDLISVCKAAGISKAEFFANMMETWDEVKVEVKVPGFNLTDWGTKQ